MGGAQLEAAGDDENVDPTEVLSRLAGTSITPRKLMAFDLFCKGTTRPGEIAERVNEAFPAGREIKASTVSSWKQQYWWQALVDVWFSEAQESFMRGIVDHDEATLKAYREIIDGDRAEDRSTNAASALIKSRMSMGKSPLIDGRPQQQITNTTLNVSGDITVEQINQLTSEEILRWQQTGIKPPKLVK